MIVGHLAVLEQAECFDRLDEVSLILGFFCFSQIQLGSLKIYHVVNVHVALDIYTDGIILSVLRRFDNLSKDEECLLDEVLQDLAREGYRCTWLTNDNLLDLILTDYDSHLFCARIEVVAQDLTLAKTAHFELLSPANLHRFSKVEIDDELVAAEV